VVINLTFSPAVKIRKSPLSPSTNSQESKTPIKFSDKVTIRCLRKSWATNLANAGAPPHTLMKMGGWSDIETALKYYIRTSDENEKKAVEILDELMQSSQEVEAGREGVAKG
jgi:integrase